MHNSIWFIIILTHEKKINYNFCRHHKLELIHLSLQIYFLVYWCTLNFRFYYILISCIFVNVRLCILHLYAHYIKVVVFIFYPHLIHISVKYFNNTKIQTWILQSEWSGSEPHSYPCTRSHYWRIVHAQQYVYLCVCVCVYIRKERRQEKGKYSSLTPWSFNNGCQFILSSSVRESSY